MTKQAGLTKAALTAAALLGLALAPSTAEAQLSFSGCAYGSSSSFKVCASAESWYDAPTGTLFFQVRNLNESSATNPSFADYASDTGGWGTIASIGLENMVNNVDYTVGTKGLKIAVKYWNGTAFDSFERTKWQLGASALQIQHTGATVTQGHAQGLVGGYDPGPANKGHLQTTDGRFAQFEISGFTGFAFNEDVLFEWHARQVAAENCRSVSASCATDNSLKGSIAAIRPTIGTPASVAPEPMSMVLMASGLAGLAVLRRRRRRGSAES